MLTRSSAVAVIADRTAYDVCIPERYVGETEFQCETHTERMLDYNHSGLYSLVL